MVHPEQELATKLPKDFLYHCATKDMNSYQLPFSEMFFVLVPVLVQSFRRDAKSANDFNGKAAKVKMPSKDGSNSHQQARIYG